MSHKYTDSAKVFISIVYLIIIGSVFLLAFLVYTPENENAARFISQENVSMNCIIR